jgi:hypothetical protein
MMMRSSPGVPVGAQGVNGGAGKKTCQKKNGGKEEQQEQQEEEQDNHAKGPTKRPARATNDTGRTGPGTVHVRPCSLLCLPSPPPTTTTTTTTTTFILQASFLISGFK